MIWGWIWDDFGLILGGFGDDFGMILRWFCDDFRMVLEWFWYHVGVISKNHVFQFWPYVLYRAFDAEIHGDPIFYDLCAIWLVFCIFHFVIFFFVVFV